MGGCYCHKAASHCYTSDTTPANGMINTRTHAFPQMSISRVTGYVDDFDVEVLTSLVKGSMGRCSDDPLYVVISTVPWRLMKQRPTYISGSVIPLVANAQSRWALHARHEDGFSATRGSSTSAIRMVIPVQNFKSIKKCALVGRRLELAS